MKKLFHDRQLWTLTASSCLPDCRQEPAVEYIQVIEALQWRVWLPSRVALMGCMVAAPAAHAKTLRLLQVSVMDPVVHQLVITVTTHNVSLVGAMMLTLSRGVSRWQMCGHLLHVLGPNVTGRT
jgi:hypothetical protein